MATSIRLVMNPAGIRQQLKSAAVANNLLSRGYRVASAARAGSGKGAEYFVSARTGKNRVRVSVITANGEAMKAEATTRALSRALEAARG